MTLTYKTLRTVNVVRCARWHEVGTAEWDDDAWLVALLGEIGEVANVVKKLHRIALGIPGGVNSTKEKHLVDLGEELTDVILYTDLLAWYRGRPALRSGRTEIVVRKPAKTITPIELARETRHTLVLLAR